MDEMPKLLQARVKPDCQWKVITALQGQEYTQRDWRPVPAGLEAEAEAHPMLDVREAPEPEPEAEPAPKPAGKGGKGGGKK